MACIIDEVHEAALALLFLSAALPPEEKLPKMSRELRRINDWNGAQRAARGTSGEVTSGGQTYACGAGRALRQRASRHPDQ